MLLDVEGGPCLGRYAVTLHLGESGIALACASGLDFFRAGVLIASEVFSLLHCFQHRTQSDQADAAAEAQAIQLREEQPYCGM